MPDFVGSITLIALWGLVIATMLALQSLRVFDRVAQLRPPLILLIPIEFVAIALVLLQIIEDLQLTLAEWGVSSGHLDRWLGQLAFPGAAQVTFVAMLVVLLMETIRMCYAPVGESAESEAQQRRSALLIGLLVVCMILTFTHLQCFMQPETLTLTALFGEDTRSWSLGAQVLQFALLFTFGLGPFLLLSICAARCSKRWPTREYLTSGHYSSLGAVFFAGADMLVTRAIVLLRVFGVARNAVACIRGGRPFDASRELSAEADSTPQSESTDSLGIIRKAVRGGLLCQFNATLCFMAFIPLALLWLPVTKPFGSESVYPRGMTISWFFTGVPLGFLTVEWLARRYGAPLRLFFPPICWGLIFGPFLLFPEWWRPSLAPTGLAFMEVSLDMAGTVLSAVLATTAMQFLAAALFFVHSRTGEHTNVKDPGIWDWIVTRGGLLFTPMMLAGLLFIPLFCAMLGISPYERSVMALGNNILWAGLCVFVAILCSVFIHSDCRTPGAFQHKIAPRVLRNRWTAFFWSLFLCGVAATPLFYLDRIGVSRVRPYLHQRWSYQLPQGASGEELVELIPSTTGPFVLTRNTARAIDGESGHPLWCRDLDEQDGFRARGYRSIHYPEANTLLVEGVRSAKLLDVTTGEITWRWFDPGKLEDKPTDRHSPYLNSDDDGFLVWPWGGPRHVYSARLGFLPSPDASPSALLKEYPIAIEQIEDSFLVVTNRAFYRWHDERWAKTPAPEEVDEHIGGMFLGDDITLILRDNELILPGHKVILWLDKESLEVRHRLERSPSGLLKTAIPVGEYLVLESWWRDPAGTTLSAIDLTTRTTAWTRPLGDISGPETRWLERHERFIPVANRYLVFPESGTFGTDTSYAMLEVDTGKLLWRHFAFRDERFRVTPNGRLVRRGRTHAVAYDLLDGKRMFEHWFVAIDDPRQPSSFSTEFRNDRYPVTGLVFHNGRWIWCDVGGRIRCADLPMTPDSLHPEWSADAPQRATRGYYCPQIAAGIHAAESKGVRDQRPSP